MDEAVVLVHQPEPGSTTENAGSLGADRQAARGGGRPGWSAPDAEGASHAMESQGVSVVETADQSVSGIGASRKPVMIGTSKSVRASTAE